MPYGLLFWVIQLIVTKYVYRFLPFYLNTFYAILNECILHQLNELLYIPKTIVLLDLICNLYHPLRYTSSMGHVRKN
jgi:hypothetical protein